MFVLYVVDYQGNSTYREDHVLQGVVYEDREDAQAVADNANLETLQETFNRRHYTWKEWGRRLPEPNLEAMRAGWNDTSIGFTYVDEWEFERTSKPWDHVETVDSQDACGAIRPLFISFENEPPRRLIIDSRVNGCSESNFVSPPFFEDKPYRQDTPGLGGVPDMIPERRVICVGCWEPIVRSAGATTWHALGSGTTHCRDGFTFRRHKPEQQA